MVYRESDLDDYYEHVRKYGKLPTTSHAKRWSSGVLKTLGTSLTGSAKRALAKALPEELSDELKSVFWLLHFRNPNQTSLEFQSRVARRSGNTDPEFARYPTVAVFGALKQLVNSDLSERVAKALPPEVRELWKEADTTTERV